MRSFNSLPEVRQDVRLALSSFFNFCFSFCSSELPRPVLK